MEDQYFKGKNNLFQLTSICTRSINKTIVETHQSVKKKKESERKSCYVPYLSIYLFFFFQKICANLVGRQSETEKKDGMALPRSVEKIYATACLHKLRYDPKQKHAA